MSGYPSFWFMIRKKAFLNDKYSDGQIFLKIQRLDIQMVASNSIHLQKQPPEVLRKKRCS